MIETHSRTFDPSLLTPSQSEAVNFRDGALLVLAGPGSGKTRVIACRIVRLIETGAAPWHICAITFTNKAAEEMRKRVAGMGVGPGTQISTFHSLCVRILRRYGDAANVKENFSIYSDDEQRKCVKQAVSNLDYPSGSFPPAKTLAAISRFKNAVETPESLTEFEGDYYYSKIIKIYKEYQRLLDENNALDFDDLLMKTALLLKNSDHVREELSGRYRYLLIDEYQDTNHAQYQIARLLAKKHGNIFVVGDPDQSIYKWRGADIKNILQFEKDWPNASRIDLQENFRSRREILELADRLIVNNKQRKPKKLVAAVSGEAEVVFDRYEDSRLESSSIASDIKKLITSGADPNEIAILYRVNSMSRTLEESLVREKIPYRIVRGVEFYSRKEIRDMIAYLKLIVNPDDGQAFARIVNTPTRGIGKTTVNRIIEFAQSGRISIFDAASRVSSISTIGPGPSGKVRTFVEMMRKFQKAAAETNSVADIMELVYDESGIEKSLEADPEGGNASDNIDELINSASLYDENAEEPTLLDYLQSIALYSDSDAYDPESGCVSLMTLHAAKGLEFDNVYIIGLEQGMLPHERSMESEDDLEEERRLFFMGITRARHRLHISHTDYRMLRGIQSRTIPSSFLGEIGADTGRSGSSESVSFRFMSPPTGRNSSARGQSYGYSKPQTAKKSPVKKYTSDLSAVPQKDTPFKKGDKVLHPKFGFGVVTDFMDSGENSIVSVRFNTGSSKNLLLKYAKLTKK
ncbi:ATP-dependent DNA helicase PcrA [Limihaloglobus sulfuriphilus]|uniref:DNA 3'-5' helicase n=1 Tax=Limihaloglobus sulfuriphilus TaxID=1851148 RepID=A0A1Q2MGV9_9BACT|nr:UvrD-helicase domain-containing protein [Limihaloglobus sulfuriphilus]AQQ71921.1 ATP-dependent DNA helicase PcrA [Limihaloglobus sulfuriphilus]